MGQISLMTGPERRRRWSTEQKRTLVEAAFAPEASVAEVARRADICTSLLYRWRRELCGGQPAFMAAVMVEDASVPSSASDAAMVVEFRTGIRIVISAAAPGSLVAAALRALR